MGLCASGEKGSAEDQKAARADKMRSKQMELFLGNSQQADQQISKLLLLGAGESGKSTLFKQMITIYSKGYPESECRTFAPIIYNNIITSMKTLLQQCPNYGGCGVTRIQQFLFLRPNSSFSSSFKTATRVSSHSE